MNHSKIARLRRGATELRQQFAQQPGNVFSGILGEQDIVMAVAPTSKITGSVFTRRLTRCACLWGKSYRRIAPARTQLAGDYRSASHRANRRARSIQDLIATHVRVCQLPSRLRWAAGSANALNPWHREHGVGEAERSSCLTAPLFRCPIRQAINRRFHKAVNRSRDWAFLSRASVHLSGWPVAPCSATRLLPVKVKARVNKVYCAVWLDRIAPGDVLLADALLATWWIIEGVLARGDVVMAQHGCRITDFARGEPLGRRHHVVEWPRPPKPVSMSAGQYARYPERLRMREVKVGGHILVTTLLEPEGVPAQALDRLYAMRWNIEVDFRTIKATLQMDVLRCKSKAMVEKEIAIYLLAYNLVRWTMAIAATLSGVLPRVLSFTGAKRLLGAFADQLRHAPGKRMSLMMGIVLDSIATLKLPHRPKRIEPRAKKRRPKPLPLLTVPRHIAREEIQAKRMLKLVT